MSWHWQLSELEWVVDVPCQSLSHPPSTSPNALEFQWSGSQHTPISSRHHLWSPSPHHVSQDHLSHSWWTRCASSTGPAQSTQCSGNLSRWGSAKCHPLQSAMCHGHCYRQYALPWSLLTGVRVNMFSLPITPGKYTKYMSRQQQKSWQAIKHT